MLTCCLVGELALLIEGLGTGDNTSIEEYVMGPANDEEVTTDKDQIKLYGAEHGQSWIAKPVTGQSMLGMVSRYGSMAHQGSMANMMDPLVTLFGSVHDKLPQTGSMRSAIFPNFGSMFNTAADDNGRQENWEVESQGEDTASDVEHDDSDDNNLRSPLLSPHAPGAVSQSNGGSMLMQSGELVNSTGNN